MLGRSCGVLLPVSSLPSQYGIGTLGKEAFNFVDFLYSSNQKYWQLLPMGTVSYGDSPYASFSVFAGNPYYIDLDILIQEGILSYKDCEDLDTYNKYIDYEKQFNFRYKILHKSFDNSSGKYNKEINEFKANNQWVHDYSLFMALKYRNNQKPWYEWDGKIARGDKKEIEKYRLMLKEDIEFWTFIQYMFFKQYAKLQDYANSKGVFLIGDMPIYVAEDSVEAWVERSLFIADDYNIPSLVAGVPPDAFSDKGQLWGNPVYNWQYHRNNSYEWWIKRLKWSLNLYDLVRIDHFRGFDEFWAVKKGSEDAIDGTWLPAGGRELFSYATNNIKNLNIIAEDLGTITPSVVELRDKFNFPGMKILQFAFDGNPQNPYLPENYEENSVAYTGTHDNDTLKGWYQKLDENTKEYVLKTLDINEEVDINNIIYSMIEKVLKSKSKICIIPLQDYLCLGSEARINTPSTLGGNWIWRVDKEMLSVEMADKIKKFSFRD
jgi:4-alpha-glucanotransferase